MEKRVDLFVENGNERLDRFLARTRPELSRSQIQRLIREGWVTVGGWTPKPSMVVSRGDHILVRIPPSPPSSLTPEPIPLEVVYEDQDLIVINKPGGMVVHPAAGHSGGTLVNALLARYPELRDSDSLRPGIVHRLDKDTSGLMLAAKNDMAKRHLQQQFKEGKVKKVYLALVYGRLSAPQGVIEAAIGRDPRNRKRMAVVTRGGRGAVTEYKVLEHFPEYTLVEARPRTGRTHQVRVHLAFLGHPLVGDALYGQRKGGIELSRQFLHSHLLGFVSPSSGRYLEFRADLPGELQQVLEDLRSRPIAAAGGKRRIKR